LGGHTQKPPPPPPCCFVVVLEQISYWLYCLPAVIVILEWIRSELEQGKRSAQANLFTLFIHQKQGEEAPCCLVLELAKGCQRTNTRSEWSGRSAVMLARGAVEELGVMGGVEEARAGTVRVAQRTPKPRADGERHGQHWTRGGGARCLGLAAWIRPTLESGTAGLTGVGGG
jgi:hypothetical protein